MTYLVFVAIAVGPWLLFVAITQLFDEFGCDVHNLLGQHSKRRRERRRHFGKAGPNGNGGFIKSKSPEYWEDLLSK